MNFKIFIIITAIILESIFFLFYNLLVYNQITKHFLNLAAIVFYVLSGFLVLLVLRLLEKGQKGFLTFIKAFYLGLLIFIQELKEKKYQEKLDILLNILSNYDLSAMKATDNSILLEVKLK